MLSLVILLGLVQATSASTGSSDEPYLVEDPFAIEAEAPARLVPDVAVAAEPMPEEPSGERIICRSRPELNTRTRRLRECMTAADWAHPATYIEQQRRDINDWGAQGGPSVGD